MRKKVGNLWSFSGLALLITLFLLAACTPTGALTADPTAIVAGQLAPPPEPGVQLRLRNDTGADLDDVTLSFPEERKVIDFLQMGAISAEVGFGIAYQSVAITATASGNRLTLPAYEIEYERDNPITRGHYLIILTRSGENLIADWQPETPVALYAPIRDRYLREGAVVEHQPSIQRGTIFNTLGGATISSREILTVNDQRVDVYVIDDEDLARQLAQAIQPGGNAFRFVRENGIVAEEFIQASVGTTAVWWQMDRYLLTVAGDAADLVALTTTALGSEPLATLDNNGDTVQIRVANLSDHNLESVIIHFPEEVVDYGRIPPHGLSGYQPVATSYRYAEFQVRSGSDTFSLRPTDYVGETPLTPGRYTFILDIVNSGLRQTVVADDTPFVATPLLGQTWLLQEALLVDGTAVLLETADFNDQPQPVHLTFTEDTSPNEGEAGFLFSGYTGCNSMFGTYFATSFSEIIIPGIGQTSAGCHETAAATEQFFTEALTGISHYEITGSTLRLTTGDGDTLSFLAE